MMHWSFGRIDNYEYHDFSEEFEGSFSEYNNENAKFSQVYEDFEVFDYEQDTQIDGINIDESFGMMNQDDDFMLNAASGKAASAVAAASADAAAIMQNAEEQAGQILSEAMEAAERMKQEAQMEAEQIKNEAHQTAYSAGMEEGRRDGYEQALAEGKTELAEKNHQLLEEISRIISELDKQKTEYIRQYQEDMTDMVLSVAEKVINVSLKSSSEIIRRMIANAIEDSREKEWAKIYISEYDANLMVREDTDILEILKNVSDKVKVVVMENGKPGDLLVEYPNSAVDAGVTTQMNNVRKIVANAQ